MNSKGVLQYIQISDNQRVTPIELSSFYSNNPQMNLGVMHRLLLWSFSADPTLEMVMPTVEMKIKNLDARATPLDGLRFNFVYEDVRAMPLRNSNNEIISSFVFWDLGFVFWVPELVEGWVPELVEGWVLDSTFHRFTVRQFFQN